MDPLAIRRVHVLVRVTFIWAALIAARLIQLQVVQHRQYAELARDQQQKLEEIKAPRGAILDRYGQRLAMSLPSESVCVDPLRVPDLAVASDILAKVLNLDANDLLARLKFAADEPPRIPVGETQDHAGRGQAVARLELGMDRVPHRKPALLSEPDARGACHRQRRFRRRRQRRGGAKPERGTARPRRARCW